MPRPHRRELHGVADPTSIHTRLDLQDPHIDVNDVPEDGGRFPLGKAESR